MRTTTLGLYVFVMVGILGLIISGVVSPAAITSTVEAVDEVVPEPPTPESTPTPTASPTPEPTPTPAPTPTPHFPTSERAVHYPRPVTVHPNDTGPTTAVRRIEYADGTETNVTLNTTRIEYYVLLEVNEFRGENGLEPWGWHSDVASAARYHSIDMHERDYRGHTGPLGETFDERIEAVAEECQNMGENVATASARRDAVVGWYNGHAYTRNESVNRTVARNVVEQWKDSDGHRSLLLDDEHYNRGGVGASIAESGANGEILEIHVTLNACGLDSDFK